MAKSITIKEDSLRVIKESMVGSSNTASHNTVCVNEARPEVDEFELGQESDNPPVGGNYCHVNETYNASVRGDMDKVDYIDYVPHDNAREEGYTADNITEFTPYYELMCYGVDGDIIFSGELTLNELFDYFPDRIIHMMSNKEGRKVSQAEYRIEDILSWDCKPNHIDDVEEVNAIAKRIQPGGPSAYLLVDGDVVSFPDHIQITSIEGMSPSKFVGLGNIRVGVGGNGIELSKMPTQDQLYALKTILRGQNETYLDIVKDDGRMYPTCICSAAYKNANPNRVINDIIYYFEDGIRPQGTMAYESKVKKTILKENKEIYSETFKNWFGDWENVDRNNFWYEEDVSKVVDNNLMPKIVKHGTPNKFETFDLNKCGSHNDAGWLGTGFYFYGDNDYEASHYAGSNGTVMECYLNIRNPYIASYEDKDRLSELNSKEASDEFRAMLEEEGYDGVFYNDDLDEEWVAFYPEQIRLANSFDINENIDFEVNSSDIDLSSFRKKNNLAPIWNEESELNPKIRLKLLDIADDFWEFVNLKWVKPRGIILTGSICNFNWSKFSDIDLHLVVDFDEIDEKTEFVRDYLDAKKNEWNNEHEDLKILDYPVELYVQNLDEMPQSGGIYDLEENDWIKKPNADDIKSIGLNKFSIKDKAANIMTIIDDMYDALNSTSDLHDIEQIGDDAKYLWKKVKNMRKKGLETQGESSSANIVYKILRRTNYLEKLWKLSTIVYDKSNSITESKEIIKEYLEKDNNLPLYKYFQWFQNAGEREKLEDLMHDNSYVLSEYINNMARQYDEFEPYRMELVKNEDVVYNEEFIDGVVDTIIQLGLYNAYEYFFRNSVDYYEWPTWLEMDFIRIVKNEWCIHFTEYADDISKEGFTSGTEDISRLAFTGAGQQKPSAGYDFAFLIDDRNVDFNNYGTKAVIFRTSGVLVRHYGDEQDQVIFWGPNVKSFIPVENDGDWIVYGQKGQVLFRGEKPSDVAFWATNNLPQYRKQIMTGKNGYIPKQAIYDPKTYKVTHKPYPIYRNESIQRYLTLLKEETVADGSSTSNPYKKRWKAEREALKNFVANYGKLMQSKEDDKGGKLYKVFFDKTMSNLIGYNYCICVQWDEVQMKPKSTVYIRALDKFTPFIRRNVQYDQRGQDNQRGTYDDLQYGNQGQNNYQYQ